MQLHIQCIFAVKFREFVIRPEWRDLLHRMWDVTFRINRNTTENAVFLEEYKKFLLHFEVEYEDQYIFKELE